METLTTQEAEAFTRVSCYSLDDVRFAWKYWRDEGDQEGFEGYIRGRIRQSIVHEKRKAA